jgi:hypothetical protein
VKSRDTEIGEGISTKPYWYNIKINVLSSAYALFLDRVVEMIATNNKNN